MIEQAIFRRASSTFFPAAQLFPSKVRLDVEKLYSFLRVVDDYVDQLNPDVKNFNTVRGFWQEGIGLDDSINARVVKNIAQLSETYLFERAWIEQFFASMQMDLDNNKDKQGLTFTTYTFCDLQEVLEYVHGSAEVVGLMMARIMGLPKEADEYAKLQGRAFQWFNFIRDLKEDVALGRCYFPAEDLKKFGLPNLQPEAIQSNSQQFANLLQFEIKRYEGWQREAVKGFKYISVNLRLPLQKAVNAYAQAAQKLSQQPLSVATAEPPSLSLTPT